MKYTGRSLFLFFVWMGVTLFQTLACVKRIVVVPSHPPPPSESSSSAQEVIPLDAPPPSSVFKKNPPPTPSPSFFWLGENRTTYGRPVTVDYRAVNALIRQAGSPAKPRKLTAAEHAIADGYEIYAKISAAVAALSVLGIIAAERKK